MNSTSLFVSLEITFWNVLIALMSRSRLVQWIVQQAYPYFEGKQSMKTLLKFLVLLGAAGVVGFSLFFLYAAQKSDLVEEKVPVKAVQPEQGMTLPTGQRSILVIGANDLTVQDPELVSIWLVLFVPPDPHLTLMPVYPSGSGQDTSKDDALASAFQIDTRKASLDPAFLQILRSRNFWWSGYVVLDQFAISSLLASFNDGSNPQAEGEKLSSTGGTTGSNANLALMEQATWYQEMCWRVAKLDRVTSLANNKDFAALINGHISSNFQKEQALAELHGLQIPSGGLFCEFPTLSVQARATW